VVREGFARGGSRYLRRDRSSSGELINISLVNGRTVRSCGLPAEGDASKIHIIPRRAD